VGENRAALRDQIEEVAEPDESSILPVDALEQVERQSAVRAAILLLPRDRREVLTWKYVDGISIDAIAARMGRTAKAVESLLSRAREQMRNLLRQYGMAVGDERRAVEGPSNERSIQ
jgi:RNA polymerase sigma factor (sigma-70 family)